MGTHSIQFKDICKSDNEFSFLSTIVDLVGNRQFKNGSIDALCSDTVCIQNESSNIWLSLSAVGQEIGGIFQSNINNFIDNLVNIDTCTVKGLQSLADILGTDYAIFNNINDFPSDIIKMIDVLSIKKEYLASSKHVKKALADNIIANAKQSYNENTAKAVLSVNDARSDLCSSARNIHDFYLSAEDWHSLNIVSSDSIQLSAIDCLVSATFYDFLTSKLCATYNDNLITDYNDDTATIIYKDLSTTIIDNDFKLPNQYEDDIEKIRLQYNISHTFNVAAEADNIDNGISAEDDYSEYQWKMLELEFQHRKDPFDALQLQTRNAYYKQAEVKQYFEFIKNYYLDIVSSYVNADAYYVDPDFLILSSQFEGKDGKSNKTLLFVDDAGQPVLKNDWISFVAYDLQKLASSIREMREQLKHFCQKNFMKGTFLLISYVINEYLKCNTLAALDKLSAVNSSTISKTPTYNKDNNKVDLIEYIDPVNYFNIKTEEDLQKEDFQKDTSLNSRYWETNSTVEAIGAIDTTNIFSVPPAVNANVFAFNLQQLSSFYHDVLKANFSKYSLKSLSGMAYDQHLAKFLASVFDFGADKMYRDDAGNVIYEIEDNALSTYKEDLHFRYSADSDSELPFYYYSNLTHPSYQIHPYLSTFMEKADYDYPIENIASIVQEDVISLVKNNIDQYLDDAGYLINMWKNPLGANQDYQSHYEVSQHLDNNGNMNPVVGYDGLFYPPAIAQLRDAPDIMLEMLSDDIQEKVSNNGITYINYYYGASLTDGDRSKLISQLQNLKPYLLAVAFYNSTKISKYGLDIYGNAYILVKDENAKADDAGVLFVRKYGQPIAFPAFVLKRNSIDADLSFMHAEDKDSSLANSSLYKNASDTATINLLGLTAPCIIDFFISIDRQDIAIAMRRNINDKHVVQVPIANIAKSYDSKADQNIIELRKIETAESSVELLYDKFDDNVKFSCFSNIDNKVTVILHKLDGNRLDLHGATYDYDDFKQPMKQFSYGNLQLDIKPKTHIAFDMNNDGMLVVAYIADSSLATVKNYLGNSIEYSNDKWLAHKLKNNIALKVFKVWRSFEPIALDNNSANKSTSYFNCYTYNGFFGLLPDVDNNVCHSSELLTEYSRRGILKFQLVGPHKDKTIDYKFCLPVRVREGYGVDAEYSADRKYAFIKYDYAHFAEDVISAGTQSTATDSDSYFDPVTVNKVLNGNDASLMLDEEYFNIFKDNYQFKDFNRLFDSIPTGPYLISGDLPTNYSNPGHKMRQDIKASDDNFKFNLLVDLPSISCSWKESGDEIELDFNTALFNDIGENNNFFNEKRCFLHLDKAGDAGYLNIYDDKNEFASELATLYIKNVSTDKPMFLVANVSIYKKEAAYLMNERNNIGFILLENGELIQI